MKIDTRSTERVLSDPGSWRVLLFYGDDTGLIRERAQNAVRRIVEDMDDPFRLSRLEGDEQEKLEEEALALSLTGGRRAVWLRGAQDSLVGQLERILAVESDTLIVLEGTGLAGRSRLRTFADKHPRVASIGCYPEEGRALSRTISDALRGDNIRITPDALGWLIGHLGSDRTLVRGEIEKLSLYAQPGGQLDLDDVRACVGDSAGSSLEEAVHAALAGDRVRADQALERAFADGGAPVAFARVTLGLLDRLQQAALDMQAGKSRNEAMSALKPPVFFRRKDMFSRALDRWSFAALQRAAQATQELELACKRTGAPDVLLCSRHLARLCRGGRTG